MTVHISLDKLPDALEKKFGSHRAALVSVMVEAANLGLQRLGDSVEDTKPYIPVDSGGYAASFHAQKRHDGADVFNDAPHAPIIEYGSRPHWPPFQPLFEWALRKLRGKGKAVGGQRSATQSRVGRRKGKSKAEQLVTEARSWARGVQIAHSKHGMKPRRVFARALPQMRKDVGMLIRARLGGGKRQ